MFIMLLFTFEDDAPTELAPCSNCGRNFNVESLVSHLVRFTIIYIGFQWSCYMVYFNKKLLLHITKLPQHKSSIKFFLL